MDIRRDLLYNLVNNIIGLGQIVILREDTRLVVRNKVILSMHDVCSVYAQIVYT
jgi:hypothetical protein